MASQKPHQEIELKRLLVGDGAADKLIAALGQAPTVKQQVNHVFDTDDQRLNRQRYAVRLRFENGAPILTVKGPGRSVGTGTGVHTEAEAGIPLPVADDILAGRRDPVEVLRAHERNPAFGALWAGLDEARGGRPLCEAGRFQNQRRTVPVVLPSGLALHAEIDRTQFPNGRIDEEVEIEMPDESVVPEVEAWLDAQATAAGIATRRSTPKIARFYEALRG